VGYWVRDRSGQDHYFEDNIPEDVAMARVRRMDDPQSVGSGNFFGDMNEYIQEGIGNVGSSIGSLITMLDPTAEGARERGDVPIGDQLSRSSRDYGRRYGTERLSPEALEARYRESPLYNEDTGVNWRNILGSSVSSVPFMGATMATGTVAGLAGASPGVSAGISAATEGALGGGSVADVIDESIRDIAASDPDTFINSELGQEALRQTDGNYARAVELAANRAKGIAPATAGALTGIIGRAIGPNWFATAGGRNALAKAVLSGAMREGTEEFLQSVNEQVGQNYGVGQIDPEVQLTDNVLESGIMGALSAAPMGGGMGAAHEIYSRLRNRRAAEQGLPESAGPEIEGPAMPPPGHPARGPATGDGNPAGWTAPNTAGAEDADYAEPGERQIAGTVAPQEQAAPEDVQPNIEEETTTPENEAKIKAEDYASQYEGQGWDKNDDVDYAGALRERFQSLGMAARGAVPKRTKGATRRVEPVPLFKYNRDDIEGADEDAHAIYSGAVSEDRDISETETFKAYGDLDSNLFADEEGDPAEAAGYGLRVVDTMPDGTERVSYLDIGAQSIEEAQAEAERIAPQPKPAKPPEPAQEPPKAAKPTPMPEGIPEVPVEEAPSTPETGTEVVPTDKIKTLKPAANAALNAYRQQGEQGLQAYLGGLNVTASKSLLRNLGGQVGRSDNLPTTQGKIVQQVRRMAKSADKRGLPAPEAIKEESPQEIVAPVQEQEVEPVAKEATKIEPVREQKPQKEDVEIVELPRREARSPNQIKSALRDIAILEDDEYDAALPNVKITPEEASAVREAMKNDKGLDNLRQVFNDVLASQRKAPKKSRQTEAPAAKKKTAEPKEKKEKAETPERVRKARDAADRNLAQSISRGLPKDYDVVRRSVEQWLEVERDRQGIRNDQLWYKQWPLARQEELINRVWNHVNGRGGARESRTPGAGAGRGDNLPRYPTKAERDRAERAHLESLIERAQRLTAETRETANALEEMRNSAAESRNRIRAAAERAEQIRATAPAEPVDTTPLVFPQDLDELRVFTERLRNEGPDVLRAEQRAAREALNPPDGGARGGGIVARWSRTEDGGWAYNAPINSKGDSVELRIGERRDGVREISWDFDGTSIKGALPMDEIGLRRQIEQEALAHWDQIGRPQGTTPWQMFAETDRGRALSAEASRLQSARLDADVKDGQRWTRQVSVPAFRAVERGLREFLDQAPVGERYVFMPANEGLAKIYALFAENFHHPRFVMRRTDGGFELNPRFGDSLFNGRRQGPPTQAPTAGPSESRSQPIQARDLPITNKKWINEMERAIKTASKCAAAAGAPALSPVASAVAGLGLGGLASAPIAYLLGKEGIEQSRFEAMSNRTRELRRQYGLGHANDYIDESGEYNAPPLDEDGFVEPHVPQPRETFSPAELAAAEQEARDLGGPALDVTPDVIYRQAVIRRHNLRRPLTALSAPETPIEELKAPE